PRVLESHSRADPALRYEPWTRGIRDAHLRISLQAMRSDVRAHRAPHRTRDGTSAMSEMPERGRRTYAGGFLRGDVEENLRPFILSGAAPRTNGTGGCRLHPRS